MKVTVIGCGLRTPLLIHGLAHARAGISELSLYDIEPGRARLMTSLGNAVARDAPLNLIAASGLEDAIEGASFVISSIRAGGIEARARDERIAVEYGFAGQETTGPAGFAMALRTVPIALEHARMVERLAPRAWIVNFTNPAGLITQAICTHTQARAVGICDTPAELFFRIARALGVAPADVECDYFGLNHLGWVRRVRLRGEDVTPVLLMDDGLLRSLYPAELFDPSLIRALGLIPTEYLFFYYEQGVAFRNQLAAGATRGEELQKSNRKLLEDLNQALRDGDSTAAMEVYRRYLNRRNASYLRLEGAGESAFYHPDVDWDPFQGETGYHRIAVEAIRALSSSQPSRVVLNVSNGGAIADLAPEDVVEIPSLVDESGPQPIAAGCLPAAVRGLTISVKTYERLTIQAAVEKSVSTAKLALLSNPIVGEWGCASELVTAFVENDEANLGYLDMPAIVAAHRGP